MLDDGGHYVPSTFQKKMRKLWDDFWDEFVPESTKGEPFTVVHNGDAIDGVHHGSTTQISQNIGDQIRIALDVLRPVVDVCNGRYYHVRGTEAHVGKSAVSEEGLACALGAVPNPEGQYARWDLWKSIGPNIGHFLHHIGATGSNSYEATAVHKELIEEYVEAARWGQQPPDFIVRSHRHRAYECSMPIRKPGKKHETGTARAFVTPCWQGKTPFVWKIPGARLSLPQFGGVVIRYAHGELFTRSCVFTVERSKVE